MLSFFRHRFVILTMLLSLFPLFVPVPIGQDLPQQLAYGKFISEIVFKGNDYFRAVYELTPFFQGYHSLHWALALLNLITADVILSYRILLFIWTLFFHFCFYHLLLVVVKDAKKRPYLYPLSLFCLWNGTYLLGFAPFSFGLPLFWLGLSLMIKHFFKDKKYLALQLGLTALMGLFHSFLMAVYILCIFCLQLRQTGRARFKEISLYIGTSLLLLYFLGGFYTGDMVRAGLDLGRAFKIGWGFEVVNLIFKADWSSPPTLLNYFSWQWVGPWRLFPLLVLLVVEVAAFFYWRASFKREDLKSISTPLILLIVILCLPWAVYWPSEITFINFRLLTLLLPFLMLGLYAMVPQRLMLWPACKGLLFGVLFMAASILQQSEARPALDLIATIPAGKKVGSLIYNGKSNYFAQVYDQNHFLPMFYSIKKEGSNSQFWGRYTGHLPVEIKPGAAIAMAADWRPSDFRPEHLENLDYLLVNLPLENQDRLVNYLSTLIKRTACYSDWCLFTKE